MVLGIFGWHFSGVMQAGRTPLIEPAILSNARFATGFTTYGRRSNRW